MNASADAWVDQVNSGTNRGSTLNLRVRSRAPSHNYRTLVRFTLPSTPAGCSLQAATLRIYASSASSGRTLQALRVAGTWSEGGVTWANQPATTGTAATTASGTGYRTWAVTAQVQAMYAGSNDGFLIRDGAESTASSGAEQVFRSRERGSNVPQLVLTFG